MCGNNRKSIVLKNTFVDLKKSFLYMHQTCTGPFLLTTNNLCCKKSTEKNRGKKDD